jgi:hypothetical protein
VSSIKLNTSEDVMTFLKILAEESVKDARVSLESDPQQDFFVKSMEGDKKLYGSIHEQEEEVEEEEVEEEEVGEEEVEEPEGESLEVSLDSISDTIKQLRSGRSVDDSRIKEQLRSYFDRLDETERQALLTFLRAFSGILTGSLQGSDAPDPSDPPTSIKMTHGEEEEEEEEEEEVGEFEEEEPELGEEEVEEEEEEDISPPIKVGEPQELAEIRSRIRNLMNKR